MQNRHLIKYYEVHQLFCDHMKNRFTHCLFVIFEESQKSFSWSFRYIRLKTAELYSFSMFL